MPTIASFPLPKTVKDHGRVLGMVNFYGRFLPKATQHRALLNAFLSLALRLNNRDCMISRNRPSVWNHQTVADRCYTFDIPCTPNRVVDGIDIVVDATHYKIVAAVRFLRNAVESYSMELQSLPLNTSSIFFWKAGSSSCSWTISLPLLLYCKNPAKHPLANFGTYPSLASLHQESRESTCVW